MVIAARPLLQITLRRCVRNPLKGLFDSSRGNSERLQLIYGVRDRVAIEIRETVDKVCSDPADFAKSRIGLVRINDFQDDGERARQHASIFFSSARIIEAIAPVSVV